MRQIAAKRDERLLVFNREIEQAINTTMAKRREEGKMDIGLFLLSFIIQEMVAEGTPRSPYERFIRDAEWYLGFYSLLDPGGYEGWKERARSIDFRLTLSAESKEKTVKEFYGQQMAKMAKRPVN